MNRRTPLRIEKLDQRVLLAGDLAAAELADADEIAAEWIVNHPPRLQPGNAPLIGTPAYDGFDQMDIVWQTLPGGEGQRDDFSVVYRQAGQADWRIDATMNDVIDTEVGGRLMHSATIKGLQWNTDYEYRVDHLRAGNIVETFANQFHTRLQHGDSKPFSFGAYGDSSRGGQEGFHFNTVQQGLINANLDFSLLLGDNIYTFGTHYEADSRFRQEQSPQAVEWTSSNVEYFAIGNHDLFVNMGKQSRELYSVPVPEEGVTSPVGLPDGEFAEHSYSFDYGNTHFVTFDTNFVEFSSGEEREQRLNNFLDYVVADLEASEAKWKIVFGHHPFIGTEKRQTPDDPYFQQVVTRLNEAGADLFLVAHSHSYAWTYPLQGFSDSNEDGVIDIGEVEYVEDDDRSYDKGAGLIQVVSGIGGGSLRQTTYDEEVFAQGFSLDESTGPLEYGFAQVDVTPHKLTVSYISAETGAIVGDTNQNGVMDDDEPSFGQFEIVDELIAKADFNDDGAIDHLDLDDLFAAIRKGDSASKFDLNIDGEVDQSDAFILRSDILQARPGDANLDGLFDSRDLVTVFQSAEYEDGITGNSGWRDGDWDGDGDFTTFDLVIAFREGSYISAAKSASTQFAGARRDLPNPFRWYRI
ncbi:MAG: metallophosphoesterase family protein [Planctomycetales bacterium]|nr:metallophosphoesterase family protein [Planctomycetales bacterium]